MDNTPLVLYTYSKKWLAEWFNGKYYFYKKTPFRRLHLIKADGKYLWTDDADKATAVLERLEKLGTNKDCIVYDEVALALCNFIQADSTNAIAKAHEPSAKKNIDALRKSQVWRDKNGQVMCPGNSCTIVCGDTCPIHLSTLGMECMQKGDIKSAISYYERSIALADDFYDPWQALGGIYGSQGNYQKAYDCYWKAHNALPNRPRAMYGLAIACRDLKKYDECLQWCDKYEKLCDDGKLRDTKAFAQERKAADAYTQVFNEMGKLFKNIVSDLVTGNNLTMPDVDSYVNEKEFSKSMYAFVTEHYSDLRKREEEYVITGYYAGMICTILHKQNANAFERDGSFEYLKQKCDIEFCDAYAEKLLGISGQEETCKKILDICSPLYYLLVTVRERGEAPPALYYHGLFYAFRLGCAVANKYYETEAEKKKEREKETNAETGIYLYLESADGRLMRIPQSRAAEFVERQEKIKSGEIKLKEPTAEELQAIIDDPLNADLFGTATQTVACHEEKKAEEETYHYVTAANGMTARIPSSQLAEWQKTQEAFKNGTAKPYEATDEDLAYFKSLMQKSLEQVSKSKTAPTTETQDSQHN